MFTTAHLSAPHEPAPRTFGRYADPGCIPRRARAHRASSRRRQRINLGFDASRRCPSGGLFRRSRRSNRHDESRRAAEHRCEFSSRVQQRRRRPPMLKRTSGSLIAPPLSAAQAGRFASNSSPFDSRPNRTMACRMPNSCPIPAQPRLLKANHGQRFPLQVTKTPSQSLPVLVFQAGHASSILVTRSTASALVNSLSTCSSYSNTQMRRITKLVICIS
jgi:hypothetical protein